jgi:hypothetical protein
MRAMRWTCSSIAACFVVLALPVLPGCEKQPPSSPKSCFEALDKSRQLLSVPDHDASKGWLARAKKDCLVDQQATLAELEKDIAASEAKAAEKAKEREESFKPKPANQSLVPGFVDAVVKYRDNKKRDKCETDPCAEVEPVGTLTIRKNTAKGSRDTFRVFTRITKERAVCEQLGQGSVKKRTESESQIKLQCEITGGPLSGLSALLEQEKERPETNVVVFSPKWLERDEQLRTTLAADK